MGFVCPQLKFAFGLLWDAVASVPANGIRHDLATEIIDEWVRTSDSVAPDGEKIGADGTPETVRLSHTVWSHPLLCHRRDARSDGGRGAAAPPGQQIAMATALLLLLALTAQGGLRTSQVAVRGPPSVSNCNTTTAGYNRL